MTGRLGYKDNTDNELVAALQGGDRRALAEVYLRHGQSVGKALRRFAPSLASADVEDLTQEVFIGLFRTAERFRPPAEFRSFLLSITLRVGRNFERKRWWRARLMGLHLFASSGAAGEESPSHALQVEAREEIVLALSELPRDQLEVLLLREVEGLTDEAIAEILGIRVGTVWTRLHRARRTLVSMRRAEVPARRKAEVES